MVQFFFFTLFLFSRISTVNLCYLYIQEYNLFVKDTVVYNCGVNVFYITSAVLRHREKGSSRSYHGHIGS